MTQPFIGQISMTGFNFAPKGWALCDGQLLSIAQNTALFSLIGTTYGGNGQTTFGLPNLQSRSPMHQGTGPGLTPRSEGEMSGSETVTLVSSQMPMHNHLARATSQPGTTQSPAGNYWAKESEGVTTNYASTANGTMNPGAIGLAGGSQPHRNMQPYLVISFAIALYGVYPSRN